MKSCVLYDSNFGNTKKIAEIVAKELGRSTHAISVIDFNQEKLKDYDFLVVGSPINGWKPSKKMNEFLSSLSKEQLKGVLTASFDTRIDVFFHGDAAYQIAEKLEAAGAKVVTKPESFYVQGTEGPLSDGAAAKAVEWGQSLKKLAQKN